MLIKDIYFKILDMLDKEDYSLSYISTELGTSIDVVKKVSQMRTARLRFQELNLSKEETEFLNNIWFNIIHLKEVDNREDMKLIIALLKTFNEVNRHNILIARACLECKKKSISNCKHDIEITELSIKELEYKLEEVESNRKEHKKKIKVIMKVIKSYPVEKQEFIISLLGFHKDIFSNNSLSKREYSLFVNRRLDVKQFRYLTKNNIIKYHRFENCCEILDLESFLNKIIEDDSLVGGKSTSRFIMDFDYDYLALEKGNIKEDIKKKTQLLQEYKYSLKKELESGLETELECVEKRYNELKLKTEHLDEIGFTFKFYRLKGELRSKNIVFTENLFNIDKEHYVVDYDDEIAIYIFLPENYVLDMSHIDIEVFREYLATTIDNRINYFINKLKNNVDKIYIGSYYNRIVYDKRLPDNKRELTKFNIYRKINKEFLFL